ncbi:ribosome maturation factor RimP [Campylobacter gastrosuis]|uniref:Ribosome maturation factor RimP n=1 Tax=Campylobacter gastrosuis TaxID=2974576 RepID=A0ABT7HNI1_9BACT|nr:ribosome maturation factor RimP [Campylobacter gastrosuis]MDL0087968.1 ribosome maturation factor RimP [Campylobacter gastrosuis]
MDNLENLVKECGVELYDTEIANENGRAIYRVYITKNGGVSLDDCEKVSRLLSPIFDVTPPISGEYSLEVSSPGLERKLEKPKHFKSSIGELVKIKTAVLSVQGRLLDASDEAINLQTNDGKIQIDYVNIKKAKTYLEW